MDAAEQLLNCAKQIASGWADLDKATSKSDLTRRAEKTVVQMLIAALHDAMTLPLAGDRRLDQRGPGKADRGIGRPIRPRAGRLEAISDGYEMLRWLEDSVNERLIFDRLLLRLARSTIMPAQSY